MEVVWQAKAVESLSLICMQRIGYVFMQSGL